MSRDMVYVVYYPLFSASVGKIIFPENTEAYEAKVSSLGLQIEDIQAEVRGSIGLWTKPLLELKRAF